MYKSKNLFLNKYNKYLTKYNNILNGGLIPTHINITSVPLKSVYHYRLGCDNIISINKFSEFIKNFIVDELEEFKKTTFISDENKIILDNLKNQTITNPNIANILKTESVEKITDTVIIEYIRELCQNESFKELLNFLDNKYKNRILAVYINLDIYKLSKSKDLSVVKKFLMKKYSLTEYFLELFSYPTIQNIFVQPCIFITTDIPTLKILDMYLDYNTIENSIEDENFKKNIKENNYSTEMFNIFLLHSINANHIYCLENNNWHIIMGLLFGYTIDDIFSYIINYTKGDKYNQDIIMGTFGLIFINKIMKNCKSRDIPTNMTKTIDDSIMLIERLYQDIPQKELSLFYKRIQNIKNYKKTKGTYIGCIE